MSGKRPLLERLALHRPELRAWAMYDWANSAMITTVVTAVFPSFYALVAASDLAKEEATQKLAVITAIAMAFVAVLAPILGTFSDYTAAKKRFMGTFLGIGVTATACMYFIGQGDLLLASVLFVAANIGAAGSFVFYDALLPHVARPEEQDGLSTSAYALGYLGGGLLLAVQLGFILNPEWMGQPEDSILPVRLAFISVAVWWLLFSIPLFRRVPEPPVQIEEDERPGLSAFKGSFSRLLHTLRELRRFRHAFVLMLAFLIYNDGIGTIIRMAVIFGTEIGLEQSDLIGAVLLVQFVGVPFAFGFGALAGKIGAKKSIFFGLAVYLCITVLAYFMTTAAHFWTLAILVGAVQGGTQALSRSLFSSMVPKHKSAQFFGLFAVAEKFAGIAGPTVFAMAIELFRGSRPAIATIAGFFVLGGLLLTRVDVDAGRKAARDAEAHAHAAA